MSEETVKSEEEIRAEISHVETHRTGSFEVQAGALAALKWVLGEGDGEHIDV